MSTATPSPIATTLPAQPALASDPALIGADLAADEQTLRDPSSSEGALVSAALRQQAAYRAIGRHPEWDSAVRSKIPPSLVGTYQRNVDARHHLIALNGGEAKNTLPAWRIEPPAPADALLGLYHEAEAATGVGWNYLAAINLVETGFGRIVGLSTAGAQGPMQFLPSTFASYGNGGDIVSPHDSIMAAGRFLAANGFANDRDRAIFGYNHSGEYVGAINDYAAVLASDPAAFAGYYRWDIYYYTTSGDVLLPIGYAQAQRIPVADYLASHPQ
jgi:soluble lytic murein transglycosylase-like protein